MSEAQLTTSQVASLSECLDDLGWAIFDIEDALEQAKRSEDCFERATILGLASKALVCLARIVAVESGDEQWG